MALTVEKTDWALELNAAKDQTVQALRGWEEELRRFAPGLYESWWTDCGFSTSTTSEVDPENHAFELVALLLPELVYSNPRVRITSPRPDPEARLKARGLSAACNRWIRDTDMKQLNEELAMDYFFRYAVALVTRTAYPWDTSEMDDPPMWPRVDRVSPDDFVWDAKARSMKTARFLGHKVRKDREDALARAEAEPEEGWDVVAIQALGSAMDHNRPGGRNAARDEPSLNRDEIEYYELWVPEIELEDHPDYDKRLTHGAWLTVATVTARDGSAAQYLLRDPYPARNPRSGPYVWAGAYIVPGEAATLSPVNSTKQSQVALNRAARALDRDIQDYKNGLIAPDEARELLEQITDMEHHGVATVGLPPDKISAAIVPFQVGGATDQGLNALQLYRDRLERASGIAAAMRGAVTGVGTATENAIANDRASSRMAKVAQRFRDGVVDIVRGVAFHLDAEDGLVMEFGDDARIPVPQQGQVPQFAGGLEDGEVSVEAEPFDYEIEAFSMGRVPDSVQQQRAANLLGWVQTVATLGPQTPYVDWGQLSSSIAEIYNAPELEYVIDYRQMREVGLMMMQAQGMQEPQGQASPQPRVSRDRTAQPSISVSAGGLRAAQPPKLPDGAGQASVG